MSGRTHAHSARSGRTERSGKPARSDKPARSGKPTRSSGTRSGKPARSGPSPRPGKARPTSKARPSTTTSSRPFSRSPQGPGAKGTGTRRRRARSVRSGARASTTAAPASSSKRAATRTKQPTSALTRRSRIPLALAAIFAAAVLVTSFPLSSLLSQHRALSAAAAQLATVRHEDQTLSEQQQDLTSKTAIDRLARQDYQMVLPGQTLYDVLPPSGQTTTTSAGTSASGDPGDQPLVSPDHAPDLTPESALTPSTVPVATGSATASGSATVTRAAGGSAPTGGFWSRVSSTLEFWK